MQSLVCSFVGLARSAHQLASDISLLAAAIMIADVSGFTALTEALSGQGSVGVELLTRCMNRYFTQVRALHREELSGREVKLHGGLPLLWLCTMQGLSARALT